MAVLLRASGGRFICREWQQLYPNTNVFQSSSSLCRQPSCEQLAHDSPVDIGQPMIPALEAKRETAMVDAQQMQHRGA